MLPRKIYWMCAWVGLLNVFATQAASKSTATGLEKEFTGNTRLLIKQYCLDCHSTAKHKGDLDLEHFTSAAAVLKTSKVWQGVVEQMSLGEMPPKDKPQPTPAERERLLKWVNAALDEAAREHAGDPGPVVLRRLNNAEYTFTVRDLTSVDSLNPTRDFPTDSAAGEGFMNTGNTLVMSPALLTKYLDAGKDIASHVVLLPDGFRFSPKTTRRDWTEEILTQIRAFYRDFTDPRGGDKVNLQGVVFETNAGGRLPLEKYLAATLELRDALKTGTSTLEATARARGLSVKYLRSLLAVLNSTEPSLLLDPIRARWRTAKPGDAAALATEIAQWQKALWKFNTVGHIGKLDGPKEWMSAVNPLVAKQEVRVKFSTVPANGEVTLYLTAGDAGDRNENDFVLWQQPRLVAPGRPTLLLRDVRVVADELARRREHIFAATAKSLTAVAEASAAPQRIDVAELAAKHGVEAEVLSAWLDYFGIGASASLKLDYFTNRLDKASTYAFIKGWGRSETPLVVANSSDQPVRIPGNMPAHSVAVHPSPTLQAVIGWRSPVATTLRVAAKVQHAHPECGNGVTWSLELRRGATRQPLAAGTAQGAKEVKVGPLENIAVQTGDLISLLIGPRNGNHSCDLTEIDLTLTSAGDGGREWNLAKELSPEIIGGNPHADRFGNEGVWHLYTEPDNGGTHSGPVIPAGSLLAKWQAAGSVADKTKLASEVQQLLTATAPTRNDSPDAALYRQLTSLGGPLLSQVLGAARTNPSLAISVTNTWGMDPALFGKHPNGSAVDAASLCLRAPSVLEIRLPAELVVGCEFVTTGLLEPQTGAEGSVQLQVLTNKPAGTAGLVASSIQSQTAQGTWTESSKPATYTSPIVVNDGSGARKRMEKAFNEFREIFPDALCYSKIVPVDEVVTLTLFHREDQHLSRLMLDDAQRAQLDRLWNEFHYISHDAFTLVDAFEQIWQYSTQDGPNAPNGDKRLEPLREPINQRAAALRQLLVSTQPKHVEAALEFASRAYRRPLTANEKNELRGLYQRLRAQELPHDDAVRLLLARVFVSPAFLYRGEKAGPGTKATAVNDWELASRLSYFLWSSAPDAELHELAAQGKLRDSKVLAAQTQRMLQAPHARRLATEFACAWLHIYGFDELSEKSERHFPTFVGVRGAMYEESIHFFTDWFQRNGSLLDILNADYTFLNEDLAKHYGIPGVQGTEWRRVDGMKKFSRGGILGQATTLAKQSGASRTSPILRGNWVAEVLLGEKLPRPPKDVPRLPEDEATETLTVRQLAEKHSSDPRCAGCHVRIDPYGFALESFDAIGRRRERDLGNRPIDTHVKALDGAEFEGMSGLRDYLLTQRRDAFVKQFCRKLLGYALGRAVQLSDGPLLAEIQSRLETNDYRIQTVVELIVNSPQFREIRGRESVFAD